MHICEDATLELFLGAWWYYYNFGKDPIVLLWYFIPMSVCTVFKIGLELCCSKFSDSKCAQLVFINLFKGLALLSVALLINKAAANYSTWSNAVIPLWIVLVMSIAVLLMLFILFLNVIASLLKKLIGSNGPQTESVEPEVDLVILSFWLLANWAGVTISGFLFLLNFSKVIADEKPLRECFSFILFPAVYWGVLFLFTVVLRNRI